MKDEDVIERFISTLNRNDISYSEALMRAEDFWDDEVKRKMQSRPQKRLKQ